MQSYIKLIYISILCAILSLSGSPVYPQTGFDSELSFNKTVHNFGKISLNAGKQHCFFEFTNTGDKPVVIYNVISSCGCAEPVWPKCPIMPGKGGKIEVTFLNDRGPHQFEKSLTVYTSASKKPIILRISGIVYEKEKSLKEMFPVAIGPLCVMSSNLRLGQIEQGFVKSGSISIANLCDKDVNVTFANISQGLHINITPSIVKAGELAEITYTVDTKEKENWGNTVYSCNVVCNGVKAPEKLKVNCLIIDNVSSLSKEQKNRGSMILAKNSSAIIENAVANKQVTAEFSLRNTGAGILKIHKAENDGGDFEIVAPNEIAPGKEFKVTANIIPQAGKKEETYTITLFTNSPHRPIMNLFVTVILK